MDAKTNGVDVNALRAKAFQDGWDACWERWADLTRHVSVSAMGEDLAEYLAKQQQDERDALSQEPQ